MSAVLMEEKSTSTSLSAEFLAIFAKACYLKEVLNEEDKYVSANDSLIAWGQQCGCSDEISNWQVLDIPGNNASGVYETLNSFAAVAYGRYDTNNKLQEIVIAYRGTDSILDWTPSNLQILLTLTPSQKNKAIEFYDKVAENYEGIDITITGHSLGGALAQYVASLKQEPAITFEAPGIDIPSGGTSENIINYVNMNDPVGSYREHIGETRYYLPDGMYADSKDENNNPKNEFKPHSDYLDQDFSKYITLPEGYSWNASKALALYLYDVKNDSNLAGDVVQSLKTLFGLTSNTLKEAVETVQAVFGETGRMDIIREFRDGNTSYIIGSQYKENIIATANNDIIWGNQGNDNIRGLDGNDLIIDYGTALGEDSITVKNQELENNTVERIQLSDGKYLSNEDINKIIQNMTSYAANNGIEFTNIESVKNNEDLMNLVASSWHM